MARHPLAVPLSPARSGPRLRLLVLIGVCLVMAGWLAGLTRSGRGWLAIGLAGLLVVLLAVHRRAGGRGWLARVVCEYALVALLVVLALTAGAAVAGVDHPQPARRPPPVARSQARPAAAPDVGAVIGARVGQLAGEARAWLAGLWRQAQRRADQQSAPSTTTPPRKHRRAPGP